LENVQEGTNSKLNYRDQLRLDLASYLEKYKSPSDGLKEISNLSGYSVKTVKRYLNGETNPSREALIRIYRAILDTKTDNETIAKMPFAAKEYVGKDIGFFRDIEDKELSFELNEILLSDPTIMKIYLILMAGEVSSEKIQYRYGTFGLDVIKKFLKMGVAIESRKGFYKPYKVLNSFNIDSNKLAISSLIEEHFYTEKNYQLGEHLSSWKVTSVSPKRYKEVLQIKYDAIKQVVALLKEDEPESEKTVKMWYGTVVDTMDRSLMNDKMEEDK
jgi:transcriptional regulator with XRE-family HTH domain